MKAKKYIGQLELINSKIEMRKNEIIFLNSTVTSIGLQLKEINVMSSGNQHRFADTMAKICDLETELEQLLTRKFNIIHTIERITDAKAYTAIYLRYVNGFTIKEIADAMDVANRTVYVLLDKGIEELDSKLKMS